MKKLFLLAAFLLALNPLTVWVAGSQNGRLQLAATGVAAAQVKIKNGKFIDKSKPVRKAIEEWYDRNIAAFNARDVAAIMSLRTDDFHTIIPEGKVNTRADMERYTERLLDRIDHFISQEFQIGTIDVQGDLATADVKQKTVRMQRLPDGTLHKVEARVVQRETWIRTIQGWKMYTVDNIRDSALFVDDQPYKPVSH
jgi:ketosteroid isomerase-like protein